MWTEGREFTDFRAVNRIFTEGTPRHHNREGLLATQAVATLVRDEHVSWIVNYQSDLGRLGIELLNSVARIALTIQRHDWKCRRGIAKWHPDRAVRHRRNFCKKCRKIDWFGAQGRLILATVLPTCKRLAVMIAGS